MRIEANRTIRLVDASGQAAPDQQTVAAAADRQAADGRLVSIGIGIDRDVILDDSDLIRLVTLMSPSMRARLRDLLLNPDDSDNLVPSPSTD